MIAFWHRKYCIPRGILNTFPCILYIWNNFIRWVFNFNNITKKLYNDYKWGGGMLNVGRTTGFSRIYQLLIKNHTSLTKLNLVSPTLTATSYFNIFLRFQVLKWKRFFFKTKKKIKRTAINNHTSRISMKNHSFEQFRRWRSEQVSTLLEIPTTYQNISADSKKRFYEPDTASSLSGYGEVNINIRSVQI